MRRQSDNLIGESSSFLELIEQVSLVAPINKPVLVIGERGTGKELIAARLHYLSSRWEQPFIKLNCSAISETLLESELFGHESGAFTGANKKHLGRFELADKGTLFLDELANASLAVQEKLLRVIEYGEFERVGGSKTVNVDVRIVAATNEDLPTLAKQGTFRADLLDRLAFEVLTIPPLRARKSDILILANHFALEMTRELKRELFSGFTPMAKQSLYDFSWPGNIRELKNVIERNVYQTPEDEQVNQIVFDPFESPYRLLGSQKTISASANMTETTENFSDVISTSKEISADTDALNTAESISVNNFPIDLKQKINDLEIQIIQNAMEESKFNQKVCAELLGLTYHQLRGYLKKYDLLK